VFRGRSRLLLAAFLVPAAAAVAAALPVRSGQSPESLSANVSFVYDGDTIKVVLENGDEPRVRLIGVDTPEYDDSREEVRLLAFLAKRFSTSRLLRRPVRLTFDAQRTDAFGRLLAYVWTEDGALFNEVLVREGYGFAFLKYPFEASRMKQFKEAEREARASGRGLWHEGPHPEIGPAEAGGALGRIVTARFRCARAFDRGGFRVLDPGEAAFEVVVPQNVLRLLPGPLDYPGRTLLVTGLVEEFRGRPQIMVGVPSQIRIVNGAPVPARDRRTPD
jgi:micrococcal nuclease